MYTYSLNLLNAGVDGVMCVCKTLYGIDREEWRSLLLCIDNVTAVLLRQLGL